MAYLNKAQYDKRRENAATRNLSNEKTAVENGMTQEQAELVSELCEMRHNLHSNIKKLVNDNTYELKALAELNLKISESGLDKMDFVPTDIWDVFEDIDTIDELYEIEDVPEDDDERKIWFEEKTHTIYNQWENLNRKIESYLDDIDKKYSTNFAPSGALRIF